jgi:hypothetical protein
MGKRGLAKLIDSLREDVRHSQGQYDKGDVSISKGEFRQLLRLNDLELEHHLPKYAERDGYVVLPRKEVTYTLKRLRKRRKEYERDASKLEHHAYRAAAVILVVLAGIISISPSITGSAIGTSIHNTLGEMTILITIGLIVLAYTLIKKHD